MEGGVSTADRRSAGRRQAQVDAALRGQAIRMEQAPGVMPGRAQRAAPLIAFPIDWVAATERERAAEWPDHAAFDFGAPEAIRSSRMNSLNVGRRARKR
jgi:hypothetical protein